MSSFPSNHLRCDPSQTDQDPAHIIMKKSSIHIFQGWRRDLYLVLLWIATLLISPGHSSGEPPPSGPSETSSKPPFKVSQDLLQEIQFLQEEEVITGTWTLHPLKDSPVQVDIITSRMLEQAGASHIRQSLQDVPAIQIRSFASGFDSIQIQGVPDLQTLFMVNGQELIGAVGGQAFTRDFLATPAWGSLEIVKGGTSVQYGSDAISGVVNLRTKPGVESLGTSLFGQYGRHRSLTVFGAPEFSVGDLSGFFSFGANTSDGFDLTPNARTDGSPEFATAMATGQLGYRINDRLTLSLFSLYTDDDRMSQQNPTISIPSNRESLTENRRSQTVFRVDWNPDAASTLTFWAHYQNFFDGSKTRRKDTDRTLRTTSRTEELWEPQFQYTRSIGPGHLVTVGGEYDFRRAKGASQKGGKASVQEGAVWGQDEITLLPWFHILLGGRYTTNTDSGGFFSPQVALLAKPGDWRGRFSYSRGFRSPNLGESDFFFVEAGGFGVVGNPNLKPVKSHSFLFNVERYFTPGHVGITFFRHDIDNIIDFGTPCTPQEIASLGSPFFCLKAENTRDIRSQGLELTGTITPWPWLFFTAGYMYVDAADRKDDAPLFAVSPHSFKTRIRLNWADWDMTLRLRYFSSYGLSDFNGNRQLDVTEKAPSNTQLDLRLAHFLKPNFEIYGGVENVTSARLNVRSVIIPPEKDPFWFFGMRLHL